MPKHMDCTDSISVPLFTVSWTRALSMIRVKGQNTIGLIEICMCDSKWKIEFVIEWAIIVFPFQISAECFMPKEKRKNIKGRKRKEDKNDI